MGAALKGDTAVPNCMTQKLVTYGLGRELTSDDSAAVTNMVTSVANGGNHLRDVIVAFVHDPRFTARRGGQ